MPAIAVARPYDQRVAIRDFSDGSVVWLQPYPANLATVTIDRAGTALAMASGPNYFAGSNKVKVVKQRDLEPREFPFGNVPLSDAGCQHFEPDALATVLHAVIDTAADHMRVCLAAHFPPVIVLPGQPAELARAASGLLIGVDGLSWPGRAGRRQTIRQVWVRTSNAMSPRRSNSRSQPVMGHHPHRRWKMAALRTMSVRCCTGGSGLGWY